MSTKTQITATVIGVFIIMLLCATVLYLVKKAATSRLIISTEVMIHTPEHLGGLISMFIIIMEKIVLKTSGYTTSVSYWEH